MTLDIWFSFRQAGRALLKHPEKSGGYDARTALPGPAPKQFGYGVYPTPFAADIGGRRFRRKKGHGAKMVAVKGFPDSAAGWRR
jgi:hypothetical protein